MRKLIISIGFLTGISWGLWSQDLQYSQFHNAPFQLNPALAGVFSGDVRFTANYRNQWNSVPVRFNSFTGAVDLKHLGKKPRKGFFSTGYVFQYDKGGYIGYYKSSLEIIGSYTRRVSRHMYLSVGLSAAPVLQGIHPNQITTDNQWDPETGLPTGSLGEEFPSGARVYPDISTGINVRFQKPDHYDMIDRQEQRTRVDFGLGIFHVNRPDVSFLDNDDQVTQLNVRYSPYVIANIQLASEIDLFGAIRGLYQNPHEEYMGAAGVKLFLSRQLGKVLSLQVGSGFRFHRQEVDAIIPTVEATYNDFQLGFSYDINLSEFTAATRYNGGPVIYFSYLLKKVHPLPTHKTCPII